MTNNPMNQQTNTFPPQHQPQQPGIESEMNPLPLFDDLTYTGNNKLLNKVAIITGGDSGIGRAAAIAYAKEGADLAIIYFNEHNDAEQTKTNIEQLGRSCLLIAGDIGDEAFCKNAINQIKEEFGQIDILVNNAAEQHPQSSIEDITAEQLEKTFKTNIFSYFYMTKAVIAHLKKGASIINTTSVTAYEGHKSLIDYSSTKGAIVSFTRSLSLSLVDRGIRVNGIAPGPIWTPLIPASFKAEHVATFGSKTPMKRAGQPAELAPAYVYLASNDSTYMTGQVLHLNGGIVING